MQQRSFYDFQFSQGLWFLLLIALFLLPAAINGFPFVMEDSIAYSGQGVNWMRPATAAVLAAQLYPVLGYWSLPLINAILSAAAWTLFCASFDVNRLLPLAIPISLLTLQPLYTSAVLVDAMFFPAAVFLIVAIRKKSPFLAILSGILLSSHGSGAILGAAFTAISFAFSRTRSPLIFGGLAVGAAILTGATLHARFSADKPQLGKTFLASRLFSVDPELLGEECVASGDTSLCDAENELKALKAIPGNTGRRDLFWDLRARMGDRFDLATFERRHALAIIINGLTSHPAKFAGIFLSDWASFYYPTTVFDFRARLGEPMPAAYASSMQAKGLMEKRSIQQIATALRFIFYGTLIATLLIRRKALSKDHACWIAAILLLCLANDLLFAVVSGPPDRYHHRILPLAGLVLLLTGTRKPGRGEFEDN